MGSRMIPGCTAHLLFAAALEAIEYPIGVGSLGLPGIWLKLQACQNWFQSVALALVPGS